MRALLVLIPLRLAVAVVGAAAHEPEPANVEATVNHKLLVLPPHATVGEALLESRAVPHDGVLRSVVSHSVVDPTWHPARVLLDDRATRLDERLRSGDRIQVTSGVDGVEGTVERDQSIPSPGGALPDVEREVWTPGIAGIARARVGERSGEVVDQKMMRPPVAASKVPGPAVALTFDDGPDPVFTPQVLQILANAGIKATFCVIGREARRFPDVLRSVAQQGHTICDHTETHPHLNRLSADQIDAQLASPAKFIRDTIGVAPAFTRAPWGDLNATVIDTAHKQGMRVLGWAVDPSDYLNSHADKLVARVVGAVKPGSVVLMHDGGDGQDRSQTVAALPVIIQQLEAQGYTFVTPPTNAPG
jgi:peptidoglycan-N-acetylglucosamine deacetylase